MKRHVDTPDAGSWLLSNEFGSVRLSMDTTGNDRRLLVEDLKTGKIVALDAFMLAALASKPPGLFTAFMDPKVQGVDD